VFHGFEFIPDFAIVIGRFLLVAHKPWLCIVGTFNDSRKEIVPNRFITADIEFEEIMRVSRLNQFETDKVH
jgi:hypothetical protein